MVEVTIGHGIRSGDKVGILVGVSKGVLTFADFTWQWP